MTQAEFDNLKKGDLIDVDFNFSNIHIKGEGIVIKIYPTTANWMDLEAIVTESDGGTRWGALPMESCKIKPKVEPPVVTIVNSKSDNCIAQVIHVLKEYGMI